MTEGDRTDRADAEVAEGGDPPCWSHLLDDEGRLADDSDNRRDATDG